MMRKQSVITHEYLGMDEATIYTLAFLSFLAYNEKNEKGKSLNSKSCGL